MAEEAKNKYEYIKDENCIRITANNSIVNIDFNNVFDFFNSVENNNLEKSQETQQELLAVLNESIVNAYNTIINGSSYLSNLMVIKRNYTNKIIKLFNKIREEQKKPFHCQIPNDGKIKDKEKGDAKNIKEIKNIKGIEEYFENKDNRNNLLAKIGNYYSGYIEDLKRTTYGFSEEAFRNQVLNACFYGIMAYGDFNDYISKKSYIRFAEGSGFESNVCNWAKDGNIIDGYNIALQFCDSGEHYTIDNIGYVPSKNLLQNWFNEINRDLEPFDLQIDRTVSGTNGRFERLLNGEDITSLSDNIISSKYGADGGNALNQIFVDAQIEKGSTGLRTAFGKYYKSNTFKLNYNNDNFELKDKKTGVNILDNNNFFNLKPTSNFASINSESSIWKYIGTSLNKCYSELKTAEANNAENIMQYFKNNTDNGKLSKEVDNKFQEFLDVDNYYDFYSTMTPRVKLTFRYNKREVYGENGTKKITTSEVQIDNAKYSFIKSLNMTDNGAKKFKIVLYDRDFNTPIKVKNEITGTYDNYGSLDQVIAKTLNLNNGLTTVKTNSEGKTYSYESETKTMIDRDSKETKTYKIGASDYGDLQGFSTNSSTLGNLVIEYGFNDTDMDQDFLNKVHVDRYKRDKNGNIILGEDNSPIEDDYKIVGGTKYYKTRNARWWQVNVETSDSSDKTIINRFNSPSQSTARTNRIDTLITGYETKFTEGGIYYTIEAIEFKETELNNYKIYQRYTNLVGTPKEVLYSVMKIVKGLFGNNIKIKLDPDLVQENGIYEEIEEVNEEDEDGEVVIGNRIKEISLSLGTKDAISMYRNPSDPNKITKDVSIIKTSNAKMYKSVKSLLDDLCAVMPAKLDENSVTEDVIIQDEDGNSKKVSEAYKSYRRFTYTTLKEGGVINVIFHYQKPRKFERIRRYNWGPANSLNSVIKSVNIKTENEYSLLSSMTVINYKDGKVSKGIITRDGGYINDDGKFQVKDGNKADYIYSPGDNKTEQEIALSYAQCLYSGSITILGDPFYNFDKFVVPYTYPIYLNFRVPRSEIDILDQYSNGLNKYRNSKNEETRNNAVSLATSNTNIGYSHFMSGFYVVTSIEHNITESGFTTTLGVMSYPNITKDII